MLRANQDWQMIIDFKKAISYATNRIEVYLQGKAEGKSEYCKKILPKIIEKLDICSTNKSLLTKVVMENLS